MPVDVNEPRVVIVTRKSPLEHLVERHGTLDQARFYLESRGRSIADARRAHERFEAGLATVIGSLPPDRRVRVDRGDLDRFLFAPDDVVVVVGQDGLVPNVAKYLRGQLTVGVNPDPGRWDGVLCRHAPDALPRVLGWLAEGAAPGRGFALEPRPLAIAEREDGQRLLALNEVFVGHRTHQSARYVLRAGGDEERQSSSGLICATGTGATGWALSIATQRDLTELPPAPTERELAWFVREPFPSVSTGAELDAGVAEDGDPIEIISEMGEGGVIFADGIESDWIELVDGQSVKIGVAEHALQLVVPLA